MILQIAAGVCLGIVAAVVLLRYWRPLLRGSLLVLVVGLLVFAVVAAVIALQPNQEEVATGARVIVIAAVPFLVIAAANRRYPAFVNLRPPWNTRLWSLVYVLFVFATLASGVILWTALAWAARAFA